MKPVEKERPDGGVDFKREDYQFVCVTTNREGMGVVRCEHCQVDNSSGVSELVCDLDKC